MRYLIGLTAAAVVAVAAFFLLSDTQSEKTSTTARQQASASVEQDAPPAASAPAPEPVVQAATVEAPEKKVPTKEPAKQPVRTASISDASRSVKVPKSLPGKRAVPEAPRLAAETVSDAEPLPFEEAPPLKPAKSPAPVVKTAPLPPPRVEVPPPAPAPAPVAVKPSPAPAAVVQKPLPEPAIVDTALPVAQKPSPQPAPVAAKSAPETKPDPIAISPAPALAPVVQKPLPQTAPVASTPAPALTPVAVKPAPSLAPVVQKSVPPTAPVASSPAPAPIPVAVNPAPSLAPVPVAVGKPAPILEAAPIAPIVLQPDVTPAPLAAKPLAEAAPIETKAVSAPRPAPVEDAAAPAPALVEPNSAAAPVEQAHEVALEAPLSAPAPLLPDALPAPLVMAKVMPTGIESRPMSTPSVAPVEKERAEIEQITVTDDESVPVKSLYVYREEKTADLIVSPAEGSKPRAAIQVRAAKFKDLSVALHSIARDITAGTEPGKSLAFGDIVAMNDASRNKHLGEIASEVLTTKSIQANGPRVVERSQVTRILDEMNMSSLGLTQERSASKVGQMLGADYVVAGTVTEYEDEAVLTITKVDVADHKTIAVWEAHFPVETAQPLADEYIEKRTRTDALVRSLIFPGWGQFYNGDNVKGGAFLGIGVGLVALTAYEYTQFQQAEENYKDADSETKSVAAFGKAETAKNQVYALGAITALFWGLNGAEAYISGTSESKVRVQAATPASGGQGVEVAWKW